MFQDQRLIEKPLSHGQRHSFFCLIFLGGGDYYYTLDRIGMLELIMSMINNRNISVDWIGKCKTDTY